MTDLTPAEREHAAGVLDEVTLGGYSYDGAVSQFAQDRRQAEESAVFDFLNWLAPQNIELHKLIPGGCSEAAEGELLERWKTERRET